MSTSSVVVRTPLNDLVLQELYTWVDQIPLSRPKKNISRDFSDGVLISEIVQHYYPRLVDLHNYSSTNAIDRKRYNWDTLNKRVFRRMGFSVPKADIEPVIKAEKGAIEHVLLHVRHKLGEYESKQRKIAAKKRSAANLYKTPGRENINNSRQPVSEEPQQLSPTSMASSAKISDVSVNDSLRSTYEPMKANQPDPSTLHSQLQQKNQALIHSKRTIEILEEKVDKLEQLLALKDAKIEALMTEIEECRTSPKEGNRTQPSSRPRFKNF